MTNAERRAQFESVVRAVADPVRRYLWRRTDASTADDVLSETLLVLWRRVEEIPEDGVVAWAIGVARLQLANAERAARRQNRLVARIMTMDPPPAVTATRDMDIDDAVREVIAMLKGPDQEVLRLWAWDDLEPREIAGVLGVSVNAATVRLHRARRRFAALWGKNQTASGHVDVREGTRDETR